MFIFFFILSGFIGGVIGGMGMGGGTLLIPILTIFLSVSQHSAQAINLVSFVPMAIVCLIIHFKNNLINFKKCWWIAVIALIGAVGGAFLGVNLNGRILSKFLGGFLILLSIFQFIVFFINKKKAKK